MSMEEMNKGEMMQRTGSDAVRQRVKEKAPQGQESWKSTSLKLKVSKGQ